MINYTLNDSVNVVLLIYINDVLLYRKMLLFLGSTYKKRNFKMPVILLHGLTKGECLWFVSIICNRYTDTYTHTYT